MIITKGKITISRPSGHGEPHIAITLVDNDAHVHFCEVRLGLDEFAKAITGQGFVNCDLHLRGLDKVGTIRENKTEFVPDIGEEDKSLAPFMVDGWTPRSGDWGNMHNGTKGRGFNVVFFSQCPKGGNQMIYFIVGLFLGATFGLFVGCLLACSHDHADQLPDYWEPEEWKVRGYLD